MKMRWKFKEVFSLDERKAESRNILSKYPDRIPVIVQKAPRSLVPAIDKDKFLVPMDLSVAQFMWIVRQRINVGSEKALFVMVGKSLPQSSLTMGELYKAESDEDGFLYVVYSIESTFGY